MALTTTTEEVAGRVPITVLALDGELDASNFERLIVEVSGLYDRGTRNLPRRPGRAHVPRQLGARRAPARSCGSSTASAPTTSSRAGTSLHPWAMTRRRATRCSATSSSRPPACRRPRPAADGDGSPVRHPRGPRRRHRGVLRPVRWSGDRGSPPVRARRDRRGRGRRRRRVTPERLRPILDPFAAPGIGDVPRRRGHGRPPHRRVGRVPDDAPVTSVRRSAAVLARPAIGRVVGRGDGPIVEAVVAQPHQRARRRSRARPTSTTRAAARPIRLEAGDGAVAADPAQPHPADAARASRLRGRDLLRGRRARSGVDFFDVFPLRDRAGRAGIVIADVTGKGIAAALLMAFARPLIRSAIDQARDPRRSRSSRTNSILVQERRSACSSPRSRRSSTCGPTSSAWQRRPRAAPDRPRRRPPDRLADRVRAADRGVPVPGPRAMRVDARPGDLVLLYTDGVTDARAASGERFGDDRLIATVEGARQAGPLETSSTRSSPRRVRSRATCPPRTTSRWSRCGDRHRRPPPDDGSDGAETPKDRGFSPFAALLNRVTSRRPAASRGTHGRATPDDSCRTRRHSVAHSW